MLYVLVCCLLTRKPAWERSRKRYVQEEGVPGNDHRTHPQSRRG